MNRLIPRRRTRASSPSVGIVLCGAEEFLRFMFCIVLLVGTAASSAQAAVQTQLLDDVFPIDNPFTPSIDEGLPDNGNTINPAQGPTAAEQTNFEGLLSVIVGRTSGGTLVINGGSDLRYQDLIIGGFDPNLPPGEGGTPPSNSTRGTGTVRIEGTGSLYNNNYEILPPAIAPGNPFGIDWGVAQRAANVNASIGYDLYVGRQYDGVLRLSLGGRTEIQDAVVVGDLGGSSGRIEVDGFESTLLSGGYLGATPNDDLPHQMIVGRLGTGRMDITNGGRVISMGPNLGVGNLIVGAVIGSDPYRGTQPPQSSGQGTVNLLGTGSTWTVGGQLQIGGFHDSRNTMGPFNGEVDLDGNDAIYSGITNLDTLTIGAGALVSVISPIIDSDPNAAQPNQLDIVVGYSGRIVMAGGQMESVGLLTQTTPTSNPQQRIQRARIINDGVISGTGQIATLQFRNRVLGRVSVSGGEKLLFSTGGLFLAVDNIPIPGEEEYPMTNYGVIDVLGTETARAEIEFNHQPAHPTDPMIPIRPFLNLPVADMPGQNGRTEGLIHGEWSVMRFRSGLSNRGVMAFTAGNNVISGNVINENETVLGAGDHGRFLIGPNTNVAFEDDFVAGGVVQINPTGSFQVLAGNSLHVPGTLEITVAGSASGLQFNPYQIAGNAYLTGLLDVTITNPGLLPPLSSVPILRVSGSIFGTLGVLPDVTSSSLGLEFITFAQGRNLMLQAFTPIAGMGADFNGDGVVDQIDYQIWRMNYGTGGPAGDANGDGSVDAADFTIWRNTLTPPPPGAGGGGLAGGTVPEPTSFVMLLAGSLLALATQRRRSC